MDRETGEHTLEIFRDDDPTYRFVSIRCFYRFLYACYVHGTMVCGMFLIMEGGDYYCIVVVNQDKLDSLRKFL